MWFAYIKIRLFLPWKFAFLAAVVTHSLIGLARHYS